MKNIKVFNYGFSNSNCCCYLKKVEINVDRDRKICNHNDQWRLETLCLVTYMETTKQHRICSLCRFLRSLPKLFLGSITVHGTYPEEAISKLFWNVWEISSLWADHNSVVNQPEEDKKHYNKTACYLLYLLKDL